MKYMLSLMSFLVSNFYALGAIASQPVDKQINFQPAASPSMEVLSDFHSMLLVVIFAIAAFVTLLLIYVCIRFRAKANPTPSTTTHNTLLEIVWTVIPVIILIVITITSLRTLYFVDKIEEPDMTLKIIGYQWYWGYQYPDHGDITFDSNMLQDNELKPGDLRLLEVDNRVILPIDTNIRLLITAADVIHSVAVPALALKQDAIPGRLNETWTRITKPGVYYGQCSELCGVGHGFMPIVIEAVSKEDFAKWVETKQASLGNLQTALTETE